MDREHNSRLDDALAAQWTKQDQVALLVVALIELCILLAGAASSTMGDRGVAVTAGVVGLELAALALATQHPRQYAAHWRLPLVTFLRLTNMCLYPAAVDLLSIMSGQKVTALPASAAAGAAAGAAAAAASAATGGAAAFAKVVRAVAMLIVPVAGVHACMLVSLYWQLPPLLHLVVHAGSVAALMYRAPTVCQQFVNVHPVNSRVAEWAHWLLRQGVSVVCLGSREHLETAAEAAGPVEKCTAVAWTLEASVGLVLTTLLLWRLQLRAACEHTSRRMRRRQEAELMRLQLPEGSSSAPEQEGVAEQELSRSQYMRVCHPVLETASAYGGWVVPVAFAALSGFIAALILRPGVDWL